MLIGYTMALYGQDGCILYILALLLKITNNNFIFRDEWEKSKGAVNIRNISVLIGYTMALYGQDGCILYILAQLFRKGNELI